MDIEAFNALPLAEADALLRACADIDPWVASVVGGRPYPDSGAVIAAAELLAADWSPVDVDQALSHHPRIGERPTGSEAGAGASSREQAGVDPADTALAEALREGNVAYEEKFGRIYLVRAKGRTGPQLLALLRERLQNDPEEEYDVMVGQLQDIAVLRVKDLFA
ncbi:2-oxo-4-hydroxy-4-carboxy-5-ureidoimidazoline decarboxylase [Nocardioides humilatus]|uniref:2-oxo-4-hydroxy-4-carboxy-5-ureidoimidazoline decarboxylase n=1 Tax=Nocardioides humilatus TaxID=2607660 RepID=A0A5B1LEB3_9ACTN|nr:2-oxo-4-hydroxy-4-carboxy-5-ureidoimidazoline decarboxylase [Nocardioides humilatus]KAA1418995.1 2-oxo-4-hydroxy-4-carboxy-5-ureidoimidazoline decarboxylase [Nocardioides humilatus]